MIRRLLYGCWFDHGDQLKTRDEKGQLVLACLECGSVTPVLETKEIRNGPQHVQEAIPGQPKTKTFHESKITRMAQSSRRA